jgi:dCMP deaminase
MSNRWDIYYHDICLAVAKKSSCLSRKIGAILVRDKSIVSTGFNSPARGYPHCKDTCPRRLLGFKSGEGLIHCPAAHAEGNCIANAARIGASTIDSILYMNSIIPCKDCAVLLINAGIVEIVVDNLDPYHAMSLDILKNVSLRRFEL